MILWALVLAILVLVLVSYTEGSVNDNPFAGGCLHHHNKTKYPKRVCNSDDGEKISDCTRSDFNYQEVRILNQNWHSSIFSASLMQIILSEMLDVPSTIETGFPNGSCSFYDPSLQMTKNTEEYDFKALQIAEKVRDCRTITNNSKNYTSCAHVMPEVWNGQRKILQNLSKAELSSKTTVHASGMVGKLAWYIPAFTARKYPFLQSYFTLSGKVQTSVPPSTHRGLLSRIFERPRTWKDYCANFTKDNCTDPPYVDKKNRTIASGKPTTTEEENSYFIEGSFHGYFAPTIENNCTTNPSLCTGHIASWACGSSSYVREQAYHLEIPVSGNGPETHGRYDFR